MIKLERQAPPRCLCPSESVRLTEQFKVTKDSVWNFEELKNALLETSHGKCAYCECDITKESKYMEVEHFRDKENHPDEVVNWTNLLPSCKRCNGSKGTHNVTMAPIVNPYEDDPKDHFAFWLYRFRAKTPVGKESIEVLDLNNSDRTVFVRFEIGEKIQESLERAHEILVAYEGNSATRTKNRLLGIVKGILYECQPSSEYAATAASVLHSNDIYAELVAGLRHFGLWDSELINLHLASKNIVLDPVDVQVSG